ncbi:hypothetical protein [Streptomyces sp. NPDC050504]|uniref:hypothetical protein n=1 Tax=Streptomyces sp. NPDC050504 TaxID=3365618 RepID=UPI0037A82A7E
MGLLWLAVLGAAVAFLAVWGTEAVAPVVRETAVIGHSSDGTDEGEPNSFFVEALTDSGAEVPLGEGGGILEPIHLGDAVVVARSRVTDRAISVSGPDGEVNLHHHTGILVLVTLSVAFLGVTAWLGRRVLVAARRALRPGAVRQLVPPAALLAGAIAVSASLFTSDAPGGRPWTLDGMGVYDSPKFFPETVVRAGDAATVRGYSLRIGAPMAEKTPEGAPGRLSGLRVLVADVAVRNEGKEEGYLQLELIGSGRGKASLLEADECGTAPGAFDGHVAALPPPSSRLCFVVPEGFRPRFLIAGGADDDVAMAVSAR